ncbi:MFS transporter [Phytoactinopolyspora limicola]|uniref:MFS transporter n=1 Tax=Phytoactinopolyspora limicola TaxID=2715536 RepID=UPI00140C74F3|nr:MFS transporter [Phytoactinopolyspora limicola]
MNTLNAARAGAREWSGLAVLALPTALLGLDVTVLYLALPELAADLRPSSTQTLWIMDAYGFLIAGFLVTMGNLGDRFGRRRLLMIGAVAFGVTSVVAAYATSADMLIGARAALGIAGATLMPSTLALISNLFHDVRQRALAIGVWATMFALGMAAGPLVGGVLLERFWWGSAFLVAVPVVILLVAIAPAILPEYRAPSSGPVDIASVVLSLAAILPIIYGVKELAGGEAQIQPALAIVVGVGAGWVFVRRQRGLVSPLLDLRLFTSRAFNVALAVLLVGLVGVGGVMLLVTQYLQLVAALSPWAAGLWMAPPALAMLAAAITAPLLARRWRPGGVVAGALILSAGGYLLLTQVDAGPGVGELVAGFSLVYLGLGAIAALGTELVVGAAPRTMTGSAAAMSETVQELGIAVGIATLGSLATVVYRRSLSADVTDNVAGHVRDATKDSLAGAVSMADALPRGGLEHAREAFTSGLHAVGIVGAAGMVVAAGLSAVMLRRVAATGR